MSTPSNPLRRVSPFVGLGIALTAAITIPSAAFAQTTVLINTFGPGDTYDLQTGASVLGSDTLGGVETGNSFVVGEQNMLLDQIILPMQIFGGVNSFDLSIMTDDGSQVGAPSGIALETFHFLNAMPQYGTSGVTETATSLLHPLLLAGSKYWVLATVSDPTTEASWMQEVISDTTPYGIAQKSPGQPWGYGNGHSAFRVTGNALPVPEAGTALSLGLGLLTLGLGVLRSRRCTSE